MPITILDYVKEQAGDKRCYTLYDFTSNGVAITGGCERCPAILGAYNAYPSRSGNWRCADCIKDTGYATVAEFRTTLETSITSSACGCCAYPDGFEGDDGQCMHCWHEAQQHAWSHE